MLESSLTSVEVHVQVQGLVVMRILSPSQLLRVARVGIGVGCNADDVAPPNFRWGARAAVGLGSAADAVALPTFVEAHIWF